ncbi:MAG: hypothetical protein GH147_01705 [Clostridia bacterium]|nr:hypothetical protein [Clostridia bacterium]
MKNRKIGKIGKIGTATIYPPEADGSPFQNFKNQALNQLSWLKITLTPFLIVFYKNLLQKANKKP